MFSYCLWFDKKHSAISIQFVCYGMLLIIFYFCFFWSVVCSIFMKCSRKAISFVLVHLSAALFKIIITKEGQQRTTSFFYYLYMEFVAIPFSVHITHINHKSLNHTSDFCATHKYIKIPFPYIHTYIWAHIHLYSNKENK